MENSFILEDICTKFVQDSAIISEQIVQFGPLWCIAAIPREQNQVSVCNLL